MSEAFKLTYRAAQLLLSAATHVIWPARLGASNDYALVFDEPERASIMQKVADLRAALRLKCHKRGNDWCVGEPSNWQVKVTDPSRYEIINHDLELEVDLSSLANCGIYWLCLWMAHPGSPAFQNGGMQDEVIFPLVERLGQTEDLQYDLGLIEEKAADVAQAIADKAGKQIGR